MEILRKKSNKSTFLIVIFCVFFNFTNLFLIQDLENHSNTEETTVILETTTEVTTQVEAITVPAETTDVAETIIVKQKEKALPSNFGAFKSYTDYRCLSRSGAQWKLQEQAYTDENGLRKIGDAYLVALGSYYGTRLGEKYIVTLSTGTQFNIILCDVKDNKHTNDTHQYTTTNGCVIEFYVETETMPRKVKQLGTISALEQFDGTVVSIEKTTG